MKNKIISIGYTGIMKCYLNISEEDAIKRYCESEKISEDDFESNADITIDQIEFDDEFEAYSIWE